MQLARLVARVKPSDTTLSPQLPRRPERASRAACTCSTTCPRCTSRCGLQPLHAERADRRHRLPLEGLHVGGFSGHISGTSIDLSVEVTRAPYGQEISHAYDDDMQHILAESAPTPFAEVPNSFQFCVAANHRALGRDDAPRDARGMPGRLRESAFDSQFSPTAEHAGIFSSASEFATVWQCVCDYGGYEMMSSVLGTCMVRSRSAGASSIVMEGAAPPPPTPPSARRRRRRRPAGRRPSSRSRSSPPSPRRPSPSSRSASCAPPSPTRRRRR